MKFLKRLIVAPVAILILNSVVLAWIFYGEKMTRFDKVLKKYLGKFVDWANK
jgi:hypothetical protein